MQIIIWIKLLSSLFFLMFFIGGIGFDWAIKRNLSPALTEEEISKSVYLQLQKIIDRGRYQKVIFVGEDESLLWWSIGKGDMIPVMFNGMEIQLIENIDGTVCTNEDLMVKHLSDTPDKIEKVPCIEK